MAMTIGTAYLEDNVEHGAAIPPRIHSSLKMMRELDIASRLLAQRADEALKPVIEARKERHPPPHHEGDDSRGGKHKASSKKRSGDDEGVEEHKESGPPRRKEPKGNEEKAAARALAKWRDLSLACANEKVNLAGQIYDLIDTQIHHIDADLRRFEMDLGFIPPIEALAESVARGGGGGHDSATLTSSASIASSEVLDAAVPIDPNEPVYCVCQRVAFGDMVACDNPLCQNEWFHFQCVGLTKQPPGNWLCPTCYKQAGGAKRGRKSKGATS